MSGFGLARRDGAAVEARSPGQTSLPEVGPSRAARSTMSVPTKWTAPPGLEDLDADAIEAATQAARDFGLSLDQWLKATMGGEASPPAAPAERRHGPLSKESPNQLQVGDSPDELDAAIQKLNSVAHIARKSGRSAADDL